MPSRAILRCQISKPTINEDRTAVLGCQLAKVNKRGVYADPNGKQHEIVATKGLIDGLLAICTENERLNGHWTHDWILKNEEGLKTTVATWRNFRLDGQGNLIADAFLFPGAQKEAILHAAEHDPQAMNVSMVFDWRGDAKNPTAVAVSSADFVERGAITEALCRAVCAADSTDNNSNMDITEFLAMLDDPKVKDALKAIIRSHSSADDAADDSVDESVMADVTDADKAPEDDKKTATARAVCQLGRSFNRRLKSIATPADVKLTPEIETAIAAEVVKQVGSKVFIGAGVPKKDEDTYTATLAEYRKTAPDDVRAAARMLKDHPELMLAHEAATAARCLRMTRSAA